MSMSIRIKLSEPTLNSLKHEAAELEITPSVLARIQLCQINGFEQLDAPDRSYIVKVKNWHDIEAFIEARGFGDLSIFLNKAAEWYMKKFPLSPAQKAEVNRNIGKGKRTPAEASAGFLEGI